MAAYGELLNVYDPFIEKIYSIFSTYFGNPTMYKLKDIDNKYSLYAIKINAILGIEYRYIMAIVPIDINEKHTKVPLKNLNWITLQTRSLEENHDIPAHFYIPKKNNDMNRKINLTFKDNTKYVYKVDGMPIIVTLIPKKKTELEYHNSGTLITALETYQTIVSLS